MTVHALNVKSVKEDIEKCKELVADGGDWEKKNKLKVYEGVYNLMIRKYKEASDLFLDSVATFTCEDFIDFRVFIFYTVVSSLVSQDRASLRTKVVHNPEILSVVREIGHLKGFMEGFFKCEYAEFFKCFVETAEKLRKDKFFSLTKNYQFYVKEMRLAAYKQFLESYKSVTIQSMADSFGVSSEFIDKELSHFISIGKISCVIDKVEGVVESNRGDKRIELYNKMLKQGDHLLNRMQKLGRALDV